MFTLEITLYLKYFHSIVLRPSKQLAPPSPKKIARNRGKDTGHRLWN